MLRLGMLIGSPQDREEFTPYRFRIHIPGKDLIIDQYPNDLLSLLQKHGVTNPFEYDPAQILGQHCAQLTWQQDNNYS